MPSRTGQGTINSPATRLRPGSQVAADGVNYCVWAPDLPAVQVRIAAGETSRRLALVVDKAGYWAGHDPAGQAGDRYQFLLPDGRLLPDPASRFQPQGVHEASEVIDPTQFKWRTEDHLRPVWRGQAIYEVHIGTFTPAGTYRSAIERLDHLAQLGIEMIQLMPLADFAGERNWGYDGVDLYAPAHCYGRPDDLRALVEAAHARGLGVILDVVYNHLGPVGNYLANFCADYFSKRHHTPWGPALKLDGARGRAVREFVLGNVIHWMREYRIDGFRLDATHAIPTTAERHLVAEISEAVHALGGFVIAEDERNTSELMDHPDQGGLGLDAVWSDDLHHQIRVAVTGQRNSYFASYEGTPEALADVLEHGQTFRGQAFPFWNGRKRGNASRQLATSSFVVCIENHDQVGNRARGERLEHTISSRHFRAASLFLCLCPYVPLVFMGQEWAASAPFLFFTDFDAAHGQLVTEGRRREFEQIGLIAGVGAEFPDPQDPATFTSSKLDWGETRADLHAATLALYQQALNFRKTWSRRGLFARGNWQVARLGAVVALRYTLNDAVFLVLLALSSGKIVDHLDAEILRADPGAAWQLTLHSEDPAFGGSGITVGLGDFAGPAVALYTQEKEEQDAAA